MTHFETFFPQPKVPANAFEPSTYLQAWQTALSDAAHTNMPQAVLKQLVVQTGLPAKNLLTGMQCSLDGLAQSIRFDAATWPINQRCKIVILAAGNVPGVAIAPAILLASAGCCVVVKQSQHERIVLPWLLKHFRKNYPDLPTLIATTDAGKTSGTLHNLLREADHILVFGANETVTGVAQKYGAKVTGFGHKISFAYVDALSDESGLLSGLARDVVLFNQQGCLSPQAIFVRADVASVAQWAQNFSQILAETLKQLGGGCLTATAKMRRNAQKEGLVLRDIQFFESTAGGCVACMPRFDLEEVTGHAFVQIIAVQDAQQALQQLEPARQYWQGVAIASRKSQRALLHRFWGDAGFSYVCEPGALQAPPLDWPNGGVRLPNDLLAQKSAA